MIFLDWQLFGKKNGEKPFVFQFISNLRKGFALFWLSLTARVFFRRGPHAYFCPIILTIAD
ncbi:MAG TPA: hypothetical protein DCF33_08660 [Saprospirales bacterium]|nr:hypothetical protein [Saprospirales bacterium]